VHRSPTRIVPLLLAVASLAAFAGCGKSGGSSSTATSAPTAAATTTDTTTTQASNGCQTVSAPPPKGAGHLPKPKLKLDPGKTWTATVATSCGTFTITLDVKRAPKTSASFASLAKKGFYDHLTFHRIVPGFGIQGGDPLGTGTGGPGYSVVEAPPKNLHYTHGIVAMAKGSTEPSGASGSQFFVVTAPTDTGLRPEYALLGKVTQGLDVVDTIGAAGLDPSSPSDGPPASPIVIDSVKIASS
jgi:peptidyl-prolyl cis-trans isomerase B (cyclophilin B)